MGGKATWYTPYIALRQKEIAWQKLDNGGWVAPKVDLSERITYFNNVAKYKRSSEYDLFFSYQKTFPLWDKRKIRDNRPYLPDIHEHIFQEEKDKPVPVLTSMNYGRPCRVQYDETETKFRRQNATADFRRKRGVIRVKERMAV
ncbi:hypothetical protein NQ314_008224 [Rhamnusium bicolor]|uniref:Uncharacterized protein n=1 Tax=Rhamnusium bicolor TaxID=1586634 RepID=A0AAV8YD17_9CUCU|nr:hypothetical protein NQ314_008224 [Rhamnusium bicolor]